MPNKQGKRVSGGTGYVRLRHWRKGLGAGQKAEVGGLGATIILRWLGEKNQSCKCNPTNQHAIQSTPCRVHSSHVQGLAV